MNIAKCYIPSSIKCPAEIVGNDIILNYIKETLLSTAVFKRGGLAVIQDQLHTLETQNSFLF